jgi:hypothetical protein
MARKIRSVTTWTRLEPRTRSTEMKETVRAELHDPLWLLARQWQLGEFHGEDAGSPISATFDVVMDPIAKFALRGSTAQPFDNQPLEVLIERETVQSDTSVANDRVAAEAGQFYLRCLRSAGIEVIDDGAPRPVRASDFDAALSLDTTALDGDRQARRFNSLMRGRVLDGRLLFDQVVAALDAQRPADLPMPAGTSATATDFVDPADRFADWYRALYSEPTDGDGGAGWNPRRMEYQLAVSTGSGADEVVFKADEYPGGRLDWHSFSVAEGRSLETPEDDAVDRRTESEHLIPTPAQFVGMPARRFWELEDARLNLDALTAAPEDLSRLIAMEFAFVYGNDWFVLPVEADVGSLVEIRNFEITNTFGDVTQIDVFGDLHSDATDSWNLFMFDANSSATNPRPALFLPPVLGGVLSAEEAVEELFLSRDEMANVAWAIEKTVESSVGQPLDRYERATERDRPELAGDVGEVAEPRDLAAYRLATDHPEHWYPLVPTPMPGEPLTSGQVILQLGRLIDADPGDMPPPIGRLLTEQTPLLVHEEEVPAAGAVVERRYELARWTDGSTYLWSGRRKRTGSRPSSSGLRFDYLDELSE